jgi:hypothetical protein
MFFLKRFILAKIESTYGTDPVPTGGANAMLARNLNITPLEAPLPERDVVLPFFGNFGVTPGSAFAKVDFEIELAGSGTAGTAPAYGPLLRACGLSETITGGVNVIYAPISASFESVTIYFNIDGVQHKVTGCRGNVSIELNHEAIPVYKFSFNGIYNAPTDTALPAPTLTAYQKPLPVNKVNTPTVTLHSFAAIMSKFSLDVGNTLASKSYPNTTQDVRVTGRKAKAKATMEAVAVATKDWFAIARAATAAAFTLTHGTVGGNKVKIDMALAQLGNPKYTNDGGVVMLDTDLMPQSSAAGNDEFSITVL